MKQATSIKVSYFQKDGEDAEALYAAFVGLFPFSLVDEKIDILHKQASGFNERPIDIYEVLLKKDRHMNAFLRSLVERFSQEQCAQLIEQADTRLDEKLRFYIRLDKDALTKMKQMQITDKGNCFHISIAIAAFPRKRELALPIARDIFSKAEK